MRRSRDAALSYTDDEARDIARRMVGILEIVQLWHGSRPRHPLGWEPTGVTVAPADAAFVYQSEAGRA